MIEEVDPLSDLTKVSEFHETPMQQILRSPEETILNWMREEFKKGNIMFAPDPNAPILEKTRLGWETGLIVQPYRGNKNKTEVSPK